MKGAFIQLIGLLFSGSASLPTGAVQASAIATRASKVMSDSAAAAAAAAATRRVLQDGDCTEDSLFVNSLVTHLDNPIGGCYAASSTLLDGFPFYALGGGASVGDAWIHVSDAGTWGIGIIEDVNEDTGDVTSMSSVCTTYMQAAGLQEGDTGPTSSQLSGTWQCTYFQDGVTNHLGADFTAVECGCDGRTSVGDDGSGGLDKTALAISAMAGLTALAVLVCGCYLRAKRQNTAEAPKEDYAFASYS